MTGCPKGLDAAATKGGGSGPDRGPGMRPVAARKHGARDLKSRLMARREAPRAGNRHVHTRNGGVFSARHPPLIQRRGKETRDYGRTRRLDKEYGRSRMSALAIDLRRARSARLRVTPRSGLMVRDAPLGAAPHHEGKCSGLFENRIGNRARWRRSSWPSAAWRAGRGRPPCARACRCRSLRSRRARSP